jgi:serpin B
MKKSLIVSSIIIFAVSISVASAQTYTFSSDLSVGSSGSDVVNLQTWLVNNGFDIPAISSNTSSKGYFGLQTKAAVIKYQSSVGLPHTGYVGPLTRGKLNSSSIVNQKPSASLLPATQQGINTVITGNNQFAFNLYNQLKDDSRNIFFSPFSLNNAFAMVYEGAKGDTAQQIQSVFGFPSDNNDRQSSFEAINNDLNQATTSYQLNIANALWVEKDYPLLSSYTNTVAQVYGGNASTVDFIGNPAGAVTTINAWVAGKTNNKIPNLLSTGDVDSSTRLVLTDAIYFKGTWTFPFDPNLTIPMPFYSDGSGSTTVEQASMMGRSGETFFNYTDTGILQALEMPYKGNKLAMLVLLPKTNLASIEGSLSADFIKQLQSQMNEQQVVVSMPKFTFKTSYSLSNTLRSMGITTAFSGNADFSGITNQGQLNIDDVIHQAYIAVDEQGTEAAAATAIGMSGALASLTPVTVFNANHPFIFVILDTQNGNILFVGQMVKP